MPAALPYKKAIANRIRKMIREGVPMKDIMVSIQDLQDAPSSFATFYKIYGHDISSERADIVGQVGSIVLQQALEGDFKSQELFLRSKGGWSPNSTLNEQEQETDPEQDESAIDALMTLLGKTRDDTTNNSE